MFFKNKEDDQKNGLAKVAALLVHAAKIDDNYTIKEWGHSYSIQSISDGGLNLSLAGWGVGISNGDYLILKNGEGSTRYKVDTVKYCRDPHDMWFAELSFSPRD